MVRFSLAAVLTLAATASAFTSPTTSSRTAFIGTQLSTPAFTTTALQMNLFDRFQRVAKANIDSVLKGMEDPEKIMNQALEDMQVGHSGSFDGEL
jgi:phage shock protein A